jgi:hypothetical protein
MEALPSASLHEDQPLQVIGGKSDNDFFPVPEQPGKGWLEQTSPPAVIMREHCYVRRFTVEDNAPNCKAIILKAD